jgi:dTDP-4-amino-4,6-dideoxygalactose transaminase
VLSFNGNKIITTSSGGALLCHDRSDADRGLSNLLAALGRGQLATLDERIARRRAIQARYREAFAGVAGVAFPTIDPSGTTNAWLTCITLEPGLAALRPEELRLDLEAANIETRPLWKPMHAQPVFAGHPARLDGTADRLFATGLCLPSGSGMSDDDLERVVEAVRRALTTRRPAGQHRTHPTLVESEIAATG